MTTTFCPDYCGECPDCLSSLDKLESEYSQDYLLAVDLVKSGRYLEQLTVVVTTTNLNEPASSLNS